MLIKYQSIGRFIMEKFFNNAGPSVPADNYIIDPLQRIEVDKVKQFIAQKRYFILQAPRQTGKTTCLLALMNHLNEQGHYQTLYANIESARVISGNTEEEIRNICYTIAYRAETYLNDTRLLGKVEELLTRSISIAVTELLAYWARITNKPTVLFLDEVDTLVGDTLMSLLSQIRAGYVQRPHDFPISIVLCGVKNVQDYCFHTKHHEIIRGSSAFNIRAKSLRLGNLERQQVNDLWLQHTEATGQVFDQAIFSELWKDTRGQPWLVNALSYELTWENKRLQNRSIAITLNDYWQARKSLIESGTTHLEQLTDNLKEARVHSVVTALLAHKLPKEALPRDDIQYVVDLGLVESHPQLRISNRIYQEVIPRELLYSRKNTTEHQQF